MLSDRSAFPEEEPSALEAALAARRARGEAVLDLTRVDLGFAHGEEAIRSALSAAPCDPHLAVARWLESRGAPIDPARIVLSAGRDDAYDRLLWLLCDPGDEVLVPQPGSPRLERIAHERGVVLAPYPLAFDGRWRIDPAAIWEAIGERTRAIVVASPSEAVGCSLRAETLEELATLELPLVIDESLAAYPLEAATARARVTDATMFVIDGPSALPELELAWIEVTGTHAIVGEALERLWRSPAPIARPIAEAVAALMEREPRGAILDRATRNLATLRSLLADTRIEAPIVEAGWQAALRMPSRESWASLLLDGGVLVEPGDAYDLPSADRWIVISLLADPDELARGVEILAELAG